MALTTLPCATALACDSSDSNSQRLCELCVLTVQSESVKHASGCRYCKNTQKVMLVSNGVLRQLHHSALVNHLTELSRATGCGNVSAQHQFMLLYFTSTATSKLTVVQHYIYKSHAIWYSVYDMKYFLCRKACQILLIISSNVNSRSLTSGKLLVSVVYYNAHKFFI
jgi:hypothetical protein